MTGVGPTTGAGTRSRMAGLDDQLLAARQRRDQQTARIRRALSGLGGPGDWDAALANDPDRRLSEALPSLLVRRARRRAGIPIPDIAGLDPYLDVALEVLAHHPDEPLEDPLDRQLTMIADLPSAAAAPPSDRWLAARAHAVLGSQGGRQRREDIWRSGLVDDRSHEQCDRYAWWNASLLDWDELGRRLDAASDVQPGELGTGEVFQFRYSTLAEMLEDGCLRQRP
jgi:hypothetical protein